MSYVIYWFCLLFPPLAASYSHFKTKLIPNIIYIYIYDNPLFIHIIDADVPEGAIIIREHTAMSNLFSCLWFNEVNLFTPRDQLSFGYVVYRLGDLFRFFMFPNCEYNSLFVLHPHIREHSSRIEWVTNWNQLKGNGTISNKGKDWDQANSNNGNLIESRGGLGLWTPYPANLDSVVLPPVDRTSKAG